LRMPLGSQNLKLALMVAASLAATFSFGQSEEKAIQAMLARQTQSMNNRDVRSYMSTLDPTIPQYSQTQKLMTKLLSVYKLNSKLESWKITSIHGNSAKVIMVVLTTKLSGPKFRNNRATTINTLVKRNGKWLTSDTKMTKLDYLD